MISAKKLLQLRKQFGISQTELAQRLDMSRPTLLKIEKGDRAFTKEESQLAQDFFDMLDPNAEVSENDMRINIPQQNLEKFEQVLLYILQKIGAKPNVGMTVLYKLLYFIDFDYYEKYEKQLMGLTYFKNTHGPTPREFKKVVDEMSQHAKLEQVKSTYFTLDQKKFLPRVQPDLSVLSAQELELIDDVLDRYSDKSAKQLSDMTHRDMPWQASKDGENIDYELAFYRADEFSVRDYDPL